MAVGLERTGRIVTAAALLFAVAIGAFVTSQIIFLKELGFGTAVAVLIDATIIRALLVPSLMQPARQLELVGARTPAPTACADRLEGGVMYRAFVRHKARGHFANSARASGRR